MIVMGGGAWRGEALDLVSGDPGSSPSTIYTLGELGQVKSQSEPHWLHR